MKNTPELSLLSAANKPTEHWLCVRISEHRFLSCLSHLFTSDELEIFSPDNETFDRIQSNGIIVGIGEIEGKKVGFLYNDFRVNGGAFSISASQKANQFFTKIKESHIPLVMAFQSIGVGIMEGRNVFMDSFATMPSLFDLREKNIPIFSVALGRCLGLSSILYQMGHMRIAVSEKSSFNLTGPEVIRLFFGNDSNFDLESSAEKQIEENDLVQDIVQTPEIAFAKIKAVLSFLFSQSQSGNHNLRTHESFGEHPEISNLCKSEEKIQEVLKQVGESSLEVFDQLNPVVRTFLVKRDQKTIGVFINPPGHTNNLISLNTLEKYQAALSLFKALGIPIISFLDTPGIDPRFSQQSQDIIRSIVSVGKRIIQYPHGHMGFTLGRCFGGATTLAFPKNFRSLRCFAVKGCQFGIMSESILEQILANSPRLLEKRQEIKKSEKDDFQDLIDSGVIDGLIEFEEIGKQVEVFLYQAEELNMHEEEHKPRAPLHQQKSREQNFPRLRPRYRKDEKEQSLHLPPKYSQ